ncbi:hypothetical protein HF313_08825 [Massilia atriviolacea]|uniref:Uncharacterized protein n=1 Tax=Massilia atriviolacea TaxID=2495579 RepID=A0A430HDL4_9BURK|nr:hypothetical protein [Massilia atriviolacea]RSZ55589.1 hypothetical protein EJB06_28975 [Massilia atriviolacea]
MIKTTTNPFDDLPEIATVMEFHNRAVIAMNLLLPHLDDRNSQHDFFVKTCRAFFHMLVDDSPEDYQLLNMRMKQIEATFRQILLPIVAAEASAKVKSHSETQRARAEKPRKLSEDDCIRIGKLYSERKANGTSYGAAKELARKYEVSTTTIHATVKKYTKESIDK